MTSSRIAVAAPNADAVLAATEVALAGGNAVDAAVAAMVVAMVTEPGVVSPLGGGFVAVATPSGEQVVVDGNVEMPGRGAAPERFGSGLREVTTAYGGGLTLSVGHGSVATPGAVAALGEAHARYGTAPWREVLAPAVAVCRSGYRLGTAAGSYLAITGEEVFGWDAETRAALTREDGGFVRPGDLVRSPDLASALEVLSDEGPSSLCTGALARVVADDMEARGGLVTAADLAAYRPVVRPGLAARVGSWALSTNPPPAIGGPCSRRCCGCAPTRRVGSVTSPTCSAGCWPTGPRTSTAPATWRWRGASCGTWCGRGVSTGSPPRPRPPTCRWWAATGRRARSRRRAATAPAPPSPAPGCC